MGKISFIIVVFALAAPVMANSAIPGTGTSIPEPSDFALFLMGVAGLVIGHRSSRKRRQNDDDTKA